MRTRPRDLTRQSPRPTFEALEARVLASADALAGTPAALPAGEIAARVELVFVDAQLAGLRDALAALAAIDPTRQIDIVELDASRDGVDQMDAALSGRAGVDAIHVFTHGRAGALQLGDTLLTTDEALRRAAVLGRWHQVLRSGGDLLLYGCDVAGNEDGLRFMATVGELTGLDVAASDDRTGAASLGGDWLLERTTGDVTTRILVPEDRAWLGTLGHLGEDPFVSAGNLDGSAGGTGWADAWSNADRELKANGSGLTDPDDLMLTSGGSVRANLSGVYATTVGTRNLDTALGADGTTAWLGFLVQPDSTSALGDYMTLEFGSPSSDVAYAGYYGSSFILGERGTLVGASYASGISATAGQTAFIAVKIEFAAGNDTITMYVNPTPGALSPDSAYTAVKSDLDLGTFTRIGIAAGRAIVNNDAELDELRIGDSFLDIAPSLVVTTTADTNLSGIQTGSATHDIDWLNAHKGTTVSLREAIIAANNTPGTNSISFDIESALAGGKHTIALTSALPTVTGALILDGTTDPHYAGTPVIVLDGSAIAGSPNALTLTAAGNTVQGIEIVSFGGAGISVSSAASAAILRTLVHDTVGQGIDLGANGSVLANDAGDGDGGASNGMNHPVIYTAVLSVGTLTVTGEARPGAVVEFFEADANGSGHGGATSYLGTGTVASSGTAGSVDASAVRFSFSFSVGSLAVGEAITATATAASAYTSEFAANFTVTEPNVAPVLDTTRSPVLSAIAEDAAAPVGAVGTLVSALVDFATPAGQVDNVTDSNASPLLGIAVTAADTSSGTWWFSTDGGANWSALGSPAAGTARLLAADASTRLYFRPVADTNGTLTSALTFRAWDRTDGSNGGTADSTVNGGSTAFSTATDTASLTVTAVNDAPTLSTLSNQTVAEDGSSGALSITVADIDSAVGSLTLSATSSNTTLIPNTGLVVGGSGANRTLTVTPAADQAGGPVTITVTVSDGAASTSTTFTVTVSPVNDGPVNTVPATATGHQDSPLVFSAAANTLSITDIDAAGNPVEVTLSATSGSVITLDGVGGLTFSSGDGTSDASMTFTGTVADINAALDGMTLMPASGYSGPTALTLTMDDLGSTGSGGSQNDVDTVSITIVANSPPTVSLPSAAASFTEGGAAVVVDAGAVLADADNPNFSSATVRISGNHQAAQDVLSFTDQSGITGSWNATTGVLTLTGTASIADYQTALRTVTYRNTSDAPTGSTRTISVTVDDGYGSSVAATQVVNVVAVNDPPVLSGPGVATTLEDTALTFSTALANAIAITDPDAGMDGARITLSVTAGTLTLASTAGLAFASGANGTASMAIAGTVAALNAALDGLVYQPAANANGSDTLQLTAYDYGNYGLGGPYSDTDSVVITVTPVNDAPAGTDRTVTATEDTVFAFGAADFAITDSADSPADDPLGIVITGLPASGTLALSGTAVSAGQLISIASLSARSLTFTPAAGANGTAYAAFTFQVRDDGGTANGGADTDATQNTITVDVTAVNDAPVVTGHTTAETYTEDVPLNLTDIVVTDADSATVEVSLTLSDPSVGTLNTGTSGGTTSTFAAGTWRAQGAVAEVNALLATLAFTPTADSASGFTIAVSVSDLVAAPITGTKAVTAIAVNDAPTISVIADQTLAEDTPTGVLSFTIGDAETTASALAVSVSSSDPALVSTSGLALGGSGANRTLVVTPVAQASGGPVTLTISVSDGSTTSTQSFDLTVTAVDDPLSLGTPTLEYVRNGTVTVSTGSLPVTDPDGGGGPVSYTVRNVTGGRFESSAAPGSAITSFSAADVAAGLIRFVHTGADSAPAFEASASDGVTTTAFIAAVVTRDPGSADIDILNLLASQQSAAQTVAPPPPQASPPAAASSPAPDSAASSPDAPEEAPRPVLEMPVPRTPPARTARTAARGEATAEESAAGDAATAPAKPSMTGAPAGAATSGATPAPAALSGTAAASGQMAPAPASGGLATQPLGATGQGERATVIDPAALEMHQAILKDATLREALDDVKRSDDTVARVERLVTGSSAAVAGSLSVGYVVWLLRGGVLLSGLLSSLPAWQVVDPLPVLSRQRRDEDDEDALDDPLERLFSKAQALKRFGRHQKATDVADNSPEGTTQPPDSTPA